MQQKEENPTGGCCLFVALGFVLTFLLLALLDGCNMPLKQKVKAGEAILHVFLAVVFWSALLFITIPKKQ